MSIRVYVTQKEIDLGEHMNNSSCPVALAISRTVGYHVDITHLFEIRSFSGPFSPVIEWIARYEVGEKVEPFAFDLDID